MDLLRNAISLLNIELILLSEEIYKHRSFLNFSKPISNTNYDSIHHSSFILLLYLEKIFYDNLLTYLIARNVFGFHEYNKIGFYI